MKNLISKIVIGALLVCSLTIIALKGNDSRLTVGILTQATHPSLDAAINGFKDYLTNNGYSDINIIVKNPEGDVQTMNNMSTTLVRQSDLVLGIATDASVSLQNTIKTEGKKIPLLFTAVTDPVEAKLLEDPNHIDGNIVGTSDKQPIDEQLDLILEVNPTIDKIGILYNIGEVNSKVQASEVETILNSRNIDNVTKTISNANEIGSALAYLATNGCKALYIPTDNLLAKYMSTVKDYSIEHKMLVVAGASDMVKDGGSLTYGVDYYKLGAQTGEMAKYILDGGAISDLKVEYAKEEDLMLVVNEEHFASIGVEIPDSIKERLDE